MAITEDHLKSLTIRHVSERSVIFPIWDQGSQRKYVYTQSTQLEDRVSKRPQVLSGYHG